MRNVGPGDLSGELHQDFASWLSGSGQHAHELNAAVLVPGSATENLRAQKALHSWLYEQGWSAKGWPPELGGTGGNALTRAAVYDLFGRAGLYMPSTVNSVEVLTPVLQRHAPELAVRYAPRLIAGVEAWCQGFSEPEAGSDLASLRLRADESGDGWVLNGQKIWSTRAYGSDRCMALVRTGTAQSRHRGLTMLLVDMDAVGVECRPIDDMAGTQHFGEIFFSDVHVGRERLVGEVDGGWVVAQYLLQWERGMFAWLRQSVLHGVLRELRIDDDAGLLGAYGSAYQDVAALRMRSLDTIRALDADMSEGPQVSIDKLLLSRAEHSVHELANLIAPTAVDDRSGLWAERLYDYLHSRSAPIYGGSVEIQRTIVAGQILGLAKGAS